jgi:hypothetical protein
LTLHPCFPITGVGHSQLNELLLSLHLDRTSEGFFEYVFRGPVVPNCQAFKACITEFSIAAIRKYGNVKFAFKRLSQMEKEEIEREIVPSNPEAVRTCYANRHDPLISIKRVEAKDTYYLGYLVAAELKKRGAN